MLKNRIKWVQIAKKSKILLFKNVIMLRYSSKFSLNLDIFHHDRERKEWFC